MDYSETVDVLKRLLKDEKYRVRRAAVEAMRDTLSPRFLDALEEAAEKDVDARIRRSARDAAKRIRDYMEKGVEYSKLREEVEALRREHSRLQERIGRIEAKRT